MHFRGWERRVKLSDWYSSFTTLISTLGTLAVWAPSPIPARANPAMRLKTSVRLDQGCLYSHMFSCAAVNHLNAPVRFDFELTFSYTQLRRIALFLHASHVHAFYHVLHVFSKCTTSSSSAYSTVPNHVLD